MAGQAIRISILANGAQAKREVQGFGSTLKKAFGAGAALIGGAAIAKGFVDITKTASDAQQSVGATETVFGRYARSVIKDSKKAAGAYGLSANQYRESANLIGSLLKNQGVATDKLGGSTKKLVGIGTDLAATFGGTTAEAVEALGSALKGEFDPLERYGVSLKQSTVNAEALRVTNKKSVTEFNKLSTAQQTAAKRQATTNLIMKQSASSAGAFAKESGTLAHQQQVLGAKVSNLKAKLGGVLLPVLTDLTQYAADEFIPMLDEGATWLSKNKDEIADTGRALASTLLPPLKTGAELLGNFVKWAAQLPAPIKSIGVEAAAAALILPRMASAASVVGGSMTTMSAKVKQTYAEMTYATTRAQKLQVAATNMGGAVRAAAGVGGMVALAQGAQESDLKMKTLLNTLGGAATGLAVGGPVGAAVGGLGGLMLTLSTHTDKAKKSFADSIQPAKDYAGTLDQVTGAATAATKAMVLNDLSKGDAISSAKELGISSRDLVNAILGEEPALKRVNAAMAAGAKGNQTYIDTATGAVMTYGQHAKALGDLNEVLGVLPSRYREATAEQRRQIRVTQDFSSLVGKVPKRVVTKLEQTGVAPTLKGIAKVAAKYNLVPKQIKALISAVGVNATVKDVQKVKKNLESTGKTKPNFDPAKKAFDELFRTSTASATKTGVGVAKNLKSSTAKARPNLDPFRSALRTGTNQAQTQASSGGHQVGSALGSGTYAGIGSWIQPVVSRAVQMVRQAIAAAKAEAKSHSPSKKTEQLGMDMGKGLAIGLKRSEPSAKKGGKSLAQQVLAGVTEGTKGVESAWDKVVAAIKKRITGKKQEQREKAAIKRLRDEHKALIKNAKAQDKVSKKLDEARDKLKDLIQQSKDYAASIKDSVVTTGDVTSLGRSDDGTVSIRNLIDELKNKVNNAKRFAELIRQLTASGLNQTALQQMLAAGPEAALATAEAISQGGAAAIAEINDLQAQLAATGTKLGDSMADTFYGNGIKAAQGLVDGLLAEQKKLDRVAKKLAKALLEAVKKQLGIKSPSRAFRDIGSNVVEGLTIGLDDTYVKRQGTTLATSLVKGFGTPALDAYAQVSADSRQQITITLTAEQLSALERGRRIQADLDAYQGTGGRRRA